MNEGFGRSYVLLDANIWMAERMLRSPIGSALLHAVVQADCRIALPDLVGREVTRGLLNQFDEHIADFEKSIRWVRQITDSQVSLHAPSRVTAAEAIERRWLDLAGVLESVPLTMAHVEGALTRIFENQPPSGSNNEQFRDCCIWEAALQLSEARPVHLVSGDKAFFDGRSFERGLAKNLQREAASLGREISAYSSLDAFMQARGLSSRPPEEPELLEAIVRAARIKSIELAARQRLEPPVSEPRQVSIRGYSTRSNETLAVTFEVLFQTVTLPLESSRDAAVPVLVSISGSLGWNPAKREASDVEAQGWRVSVDDPQSGYHGRSFVPGFGQNYGEGRFQII